MPQDIIFIHGSDSEEAAGSDDSVVLASAPPTTATIHSPKSKIVRGSAVENKFIPPPLSLALRKDFIWVTVSKCQLGFKFISRLL